MLMPEAVMPQRSKMAQLPHEHVANVSYAQHTERQPGGQTGRQKERGEGEWGKTMLSG